MATGTALAIIGIIVGVYHFVLGIVIKKLFSDASLAESRRTKAIQKDIDGLSSEIYELNTKAQLTRDDIFLLKNKVSLVEQRLLDLREDNAKYSEELKRVVTAFQEFNNKTIERFSRIETEFITILKGRE